MFRIITLMGKTWLVVSLLATVFMSPASLSAEEYDAASSGTSVEQDPSSLANPEGILISEPTASPEVQPVDEIPSEPTNDTEVDSVEEAPTVSVQEALQYPYIEGELLVKFKNGVNPYSVASANDASIEAPADDNAAEVSQLKLAPGISVANELADWKNNPLVEYAEPNYIYKATAVNDTRYAEQWYIPQVKADQAWATTTGNSSLIVAVIDTGVDLDHPDLVGNLVGGWNAILENNVPEDGHGHGTHVAGTIAATANNGIGVSGVAPSVKIMPIKALGDNGSGSSLDSIEGIRWAVDNGAKIINMSLGGPSYSQAYQDAIDYAYDHDVLVIAAAGNDNSTAPHYPAALNHVMSVVALDNANKKASFSNYGATVDIAAPGTSILSTTVGGGYGYMQGTSMATPVVSGVAALVLSQRPGLTAGQLERLLETSATDLGTLGRDNTFGYGLIDANNGLTATVDTSPIALTLVGDTPDPFGPLGTNTNKISFTLGDVGNVTLKIYDSGNSLVQTLLNGSLKNAGAQSATWNGKNSSNVLVASGTYTYKLQATDLAGNTSTELTGTITVDRTAPVISSLAADVNNYVPNGSNNLTFSYSLSEQAKVTAKLYNSSNVLVKTFATSVSQAAGNNSFIWNGKNASNVLMGDDSYTLKIDAVDAVNLKAAQQSLVYVVEGSAPSITAVSDSADPFKMTGTTTNTIKFTLSEKSSLSVGIYDASNALVRSLITNQATTSGSKTIAWNGKNNSGTLVADGIYTYKITATDAASKSTTVSGTITADKTAPSVTSLSPSPASFAPIGSNTINLGFTLSENAKVTATILNSSNAIVKTLLSSVQKTAGAQTLTWDGKTTATAFAPDGTYTFKITALDSVGWSTTQTAVFAMESGAPKITAVSDTPDPFKVTGTSVVTIKYTLSEPAAVSVKIYDENDNLIKTLVNNVSNTLGAKTVTWNGKDDNGSIVTDGTYTYKIEAVDAASQSATPVTGTIATDKTAPSITGLSAMSNPFHPDGTSTTSINYTLSENAKATVQIYSSANVLVKTLATSLAQTAGNVSLTWNGKNNSNVIVVAGTYTIKVTLTDVVGFTSITTATITIN